ncbi:MAG: alpha/beta hydrolase [Flavobacteriaceae bacterium]|nr:alpha/beta hydrolase [Flavobacteriaceae bacterium]
MKFVKKVIKVLISIILLVLLLVITWWFWPERTPRLRASGFESVSTIDYIELGQTEQCVLIRSKNINNPILLFLHGGPGMPMMYLAHEFQRPLEDHFTVVQWDRRGAGKSFSRNKPLPESMNTRQLVNDAYALIDTLKNRYNQGQVVLIGHSFGSYLGSIMTYEKPELFSYYISVGQVVDDNKSLLLQKRFIREQARLKGDTELISKLDNNEIVYFENWLFEFGGELKNSTSFFPLIWSGLQAPEYTLSEAIGLASASSFSSTHMKNNILTGSIFDEITEYNMPVYFFVGTSDYTTPHQLITEYFEKVNAPKKEIIYFENSSHFPFFEEPEKFAEEVKRILLKE